MTSVSNMRPPAVKSDFGEIQRGPAGYPSPKVDEATYGLVNWIRTGSILDYTRRARVAPLGTLVWKTFDVNLTWIMIFHLQKVGYFCFYTVHMDPLVKNPDFWVIYTSQNVFYFFFRKT